MGSEMCIRDRVRATPRSTSEASFKLRKGLKRPHQAPRGSEVENQAAIWLFQEHHRQSRMGEVCTMSKKVAKIPGNSYLRCKTVGVAVNARFVATVTRTFGYPCRPRHGLHLALFRRGCSESRKKHLPFKELPSPQPWRHTAP